MDGQFTVEQHKRCNRCWKTIPTGSRGCRPLMTWATVGISSPAFAWHEGSDRQGSSRICALVRTSQLIICPTHTGTLPFLSDCCFLLYAVLFSWSPPSSLLSPSPPPTLTPHPTPPPPSQHSGLLETWLSCDMILSNPSCFPFLVDYFSLCHFIYPEVKAFL